jgi:hypothetical protein
MLGIHEHRLDFSILDEKDSHNLVWLDKSSYMEVPDMPVLEVTKPMFKEHYRIHIIPNQVNVINSVNLGCDCDTDLPDGLYNLRYGVNPHDVVFKCKDYFKVSLLLERIDDLLLNLDVCDLDSKKAIKDKIVDLFILVKAIPVNTACGRTQMAVEQYKLAMKIIDRLNACKDNSSNKRCNC